MEAISSMMQQVDRNFVDGLCEAHALATLPSPLQMKWHHVKESLPLSNEAYIFPQSLRGLDASMGGA
jgi:hypothetical protein